MTRPVLTDAERQAVWNDVVTWPPLSSEAQALVSRVMGPAIRRRLQERASGEAA